MRKVCTVSRLIEENKGISGRAIFRSGTKDNYDLYSGNFSAETFCLILLDILGIEIKRRKKLVVKATIASKDV
jgi:hypothetical protein